MSGVETKAVMDAVVQRLGGRRGNAWWGDMVREWMRLQLALSLAEWEEFLRLCGETGVPRDAEKQHFRSLVGMMATYGNDGYNDRPAEMIASRILAGLQDHAKASFQRSVCDGQRCGIAHRCDSC